MQKMTEIAFIAFWDTSGQSVQTGFRGNPSGAFGDCIAPGAVGALPPAPRHLALWAHGMSRKRSGRRKTAVVGR